MMLPKDLMRQLFSHEVNGIEDCDWLIPDCRKESDSLEGQPRLVSLHMLLAKIQRFFNFSCAGSSCSRPNSTAGEPTLDLAQSAKARGAPSGRSERRILEEARDELDIVGGGRAGARRPGAAR
jgi:hypothetical protein